LAPGRAISITPGGRFSKNDPGRARAGRSAGSGRLRALIWIGQTAAHPNIALRGQSESVLNADVLAGLIRKLDLGPTILAGGSAGSRVSLLTANASNPRRRQACFLWWITAVAIGLAALVGVYCGDAALTAAAGGMEAVAAMPTWREQLERNPGNRARLLEQDSAAFIDTMSRWADAFTADPGLAGARPDIGGFRCAVRSGGDPAKRRERSASSAQTSEQVHALIPHSILDEPPGAIANGSTGWQPPDAAKACSPTGRSSRPRS